MTASLMRFLLSEPFCRLLSHLTGLDLADNVFRPNIDETGGDKGGPSLLAGNETKLALDCIRREEEDSNGSRCGGREGATKLVGESIGKEKQLFVSKRDNEHPAELGSCTSTGVRATQSTAKQRMDSSKHEHDPSTKEHTENCPASSLNHHITSPVHLVSNPGHSAHIPNHPTPSVHPAPATTDCTSAEEAVQTATHTTTAGNTTDITNDSTLSATHATTEAVIGAVESATEFAADIATEATIDLDAANETAAETTAAAIEAAPTAGARVGCCARVRGELLCCCPGDYTLISDCDTSSGESALDVLLHFCCEGVVFNFFCLRYLLI